MNDVCNCGHAAAHHRNYTGPCSAPTKRDSWASPNCCKCLEYEPAHDTDDAEYGLVMPFVLCKSNGGPHDDAAFVSGIRMGALEATLKLAQTFPELTPKGLYAEPCEAQQIDLLAMRFGFTSHAEPYSDEWTLFTFEPG